MNIRRSFVLAALVVAFVVSACSQHSNLTSPVLEPQFGTSGDDNAQALAKHSTGVYVVGNTSGNLHAAKKGLSDAYIRKYNTSGKLLWGRQFGTSANEYVVQVATDANNNAYVLGTTGGSLAQPLKGPSDLFLRKYTASGTHVWTRQKGLNGDDYAFALAVSGNGVYLLGTNEGLGAVVYRFNFSGGTSWKKQVGTGGSGASDMTVDGSGNLYLAGTVPATCEDLEHPDDCTNVSLYKYTASGSLLWSKQVSFAQRDSTEDIVAHGNSIYLVEQTYDMPDDDSYTRLVKLNTSGVVLWNKGISVAGRNDPSAYLDTTISADANGVYTTSTETIDFFNPDRPPTPHYSVAKFNPNGSLAWRAGPLYNVDGWEGEFIEGSLWGIVARGGGDLYVAGSVDGGAGRGYDALLKRFNATNGRTVWTR